MNKLLFSFSILFFMTSCNSGGNETLQVCQPNLSNSCANNEIWSDYPDCKCIISGSSKPISRKIIP